MQQHLSITIKGRQYDGLLNIQRKRKGYYISVQYQDLSKGDGIPYRSADDPVIPGVARLLLRELISATTEARQ